MKKCTYIVNGVELFGYATDFAKKLANNEYPFFSNKCDCGTVMTEKQALCVLHRKTGKGFSEKSHYVCPVCTKKNLVPTVAIRKRMYFEIVHCGKTLWKSNYKMTRQDAIDILDDPTKEPIYRCPICNARIAMYYPIMKWNHNDTEDTRVYTIPDEYHCVACNTSNVKIHRIIYQGKTVDIRKNCEQTIKDILNMNVKCARCDKPLTEKDLTYFIRHKGDFSLQDQNITIYDFDHRDYYNLCSECRPKFVSEQRMDNARFMTFNHLMKVLNLDTFDESYKKIHNRIFKDTYIKEFSELYNAYKEKFITPDLYFSYLTQFNIDDTGRANHHIMVRSLFPEFDDYRVKCSKVEHLMLHYYLAVDGINAILHLPENVATEENKTKLCFAISGFMTLYRCNFKFTEINDQVPSEIYTDNIFNFENL